jgi:SAM-dependent MidA family methyltransferase
MQSAPILAKPLAHQIAATIHRASGWIGFDDFMGQALYAPGLGYYAHGSAKFGTMPQGVKGEGSDFVTAPEMTSLFGQTLASQVAQALVETGTSELWEFGAGSGALALHLLTELDRLGVAWQGYTIVDVSGSLRARQQQLLAQFGGKVRWVDQLPPAMRGVVIGNEVLDAMPVKLIGRRAGAWFERGVGLDQTSSRGADEQFVWQDRPTHLSAPVDIEGPHDYLTEIHPQAEAFVRTLADHLELGAVFFIDYGFPEHEYYHPQRHMGTLMCHRAHLADTNPLANVGQKDITAHVNFTGIALAAQEAGFEVLGYCTQARFLMNCGLLNRLESASFRDKAMAQKLIVEHEMGELFKVLGLSKPAATSTPWQALGFANGDRTHTL